MVLWIYKSGFDFFFELFVFVEFVYFFLNEVVGVVFQRSRTVLVYIEKERVRGFVNFGDILCCWQRLSQRVILGRRFYFLEILFYIFFKYVFMCVREEVGGVVVYSFMGFGRRWSICGWFLFRLGVVLGFVFIYFLFFVEQVLVFGVWGLSVGRGSFIVYLFLGGVNFVVWFQLRDVVY